MMLKEERHTPSAVAFAVDISKQVPTLEEPEIKKKLESYTKAAQGPTLESIEEKLRRAEEKRKLSLVNQNSPRVIERRQRVMERKRMSDAKQKQLGIEKLERDLSGAHEKRMATNARKMQKLRSHIAKVEEIRKVQAYRKKSSSENLMQQIEKKLDLASQKRDE